MTREEKAIVYFKDMRKRMCEDYLNICPKDSVAYMATLAEKDFYDTAIKALEKLEDTEDALRIAQKHEKRLSVEGDEILKKLKSLEQEPILDKIRSEILEEKECAYADFERYKVEYLGQDWEDVYDSLPQDDFRYGMERCLEIINKYKSESEEKE